MVAISEYNIKDCKYNVAYQLSNDTAMDHPASPTVWSLWELHQIVTSYQMVNQQDHIAKVDILACFYYLPYPLLSAYLR